MAIGDTLRKEYPLNKLEEAPLTFILINNRFLNWQLRSTIKWGIIGIMTKVVNLPNPSKKSGINKNPSSM